MLFEGFCICCRLFSGGRGVLAEFGGHCVAFFWGGGAEYDGVDGLAHLRLS
jgi:hypothetical protein